MNRKIGICVVMILAVGVLALPVYAQEQQGAAGQGTLQTHWLALAMAIAAAGCGYAQSKALTAGCEGVSHTAAVPVDSSVYFRQSPGARAFCPSPVDAADQVDTAEKSQVSISSTSSESDVVHGLVTRPARPPVLE
ncbi:MAG: hypothetical protein ACE15E_09295 [Acidobacteriota bacterium]